MTTETTHVRILIDADARIAFVSVREFDDSYPDHPFTDADCVYTDAEYNGADWLAEARAIAADYAEQWGVRTIIEEHA
jgi:hypothetical protein